MDAPLYLTRTIVFIEIRDFCLKKGIRAERIQERMFFAYNSKSIEVNFDELWALSLNREEFSSALFRILEKDLIYSEKKIEDLLIKNK
jgi:hypothetical protein